MGKAQQVTAVAPSAAVSRIASPTADHCAPPCRSPNPVTQRSSRSGPMSRVRTCDTLPVAARHQSAQNVTGFQVAPASWVISSTELP